MEKDEEIKLLKMGMRGSRAERISVSQKYVSKAKNVKSKKKIDPKLKKQLLKNYGYRVDEN